MVVHFLHPTCQLLVRRPALAARSDGHTSTLGLRASGLYTESQKLQRLDTVFLTIMTGPNGEDLTPCVQIYIAWLSIPLDPLLILRHIVVNLVFLQRYTEEEGHQSGSYTLFLRFAENVPISRLSFRHSLLHSLSSFATADLSSIVSP